MSIFSFLSGVCLGISIGLIAPDVYRKLQKPIILRDIPKEEAKSLIEEYLNKNEGKWTSDVIFDLKLTVDLVLGCLRELEKEGKISRYESLEEVHLTEAA